MKCILSLPQGLAALWLLVSTTTVEAHTWVEQLRIIASNGTFVGTPGYPRGFIQRTQPDFADANLVNLIPPDGRSTGTAILPTDLMCRPSQFIGNQTEGYPALTAAPQDQIALIYEENGHVTMLNSGIRPVHSGTVFIYGTKEPANTDTYLGIHRVWNTAGTGGDKRGKLLATRPFDDGQCFQDNNQAITKERKAEFHPIANDLNCQSDVQLPADAGTSGSYTLYWVWEWPLLDATGAMVKNESYTTCMDINMSPNMFPASGDFKTNQVVDFAAIQEQISTAILVDPTAAEQLTSTSGRGAVATSAQVPTTTALIAGFITVTVTPSPIVETITVTNTVQGPVATAEPTLPKAVSTAPNSLAPAASNPPASAPAVTAFLTPQSDVAKAPAQPSTNLKLSSTSSIHVLSYAAAATSDCPDMTPSTAAAAATKRAVEREYRLRGRLIKAW